MNVVDSSAWIEFFTGGPNAATFSEPIEDVENLVVPSICILEVFKFILRKTDESSALQAVAAMRQGQVVDLDGELAILAGKLGVDHRLPLADSVIYATAQLRSATLWTQDSDFESLEEIRFVPAKS